MLAANVFKSHAVELGVGAYLDPHHNELPLMDLKPVAGPRPLEAHHDLACGEIFGIDEVVDPHAGEEVAVFADHILVVVDAGHGALGSEALGNRASEYIVCLKRGYGDKEVAIGGSPLLDGVKRSGLALEGEQVVVGVECGEMGGIGVEDCHILLLAGEELGEVAAYFSGACNENLHLVEWAAATMASVMAPASMPARWRSSATVPWGMNRSGMPIRVTGRRYP